MLTEGKRVIITKPTNVVGVEVGHTGTITYIAKNEFFFPIHVKLDQPDGDGHHYTRLNYGDVEELVEDDMSWYYEVEEGEELPL